MPLMINNINFDAHQSYYWKMSVCVWRTPDFEWHNLLGLDETDDLLVDTGGDGVSIDAHNLIANLWIKTGWDVMDDTFTFNMSSAHTHHQEMELLLH